MKYYFFKKLFEYILDLTEQRLYWMNYSGDMKSVNVDGFDVETIIKTNAQNTISVMGSYIYYAETNNQLLMTKKSPGSTPTILYNDTSYIWGIFAFNLTSM